MNYHEVAPGVVESTHTLSPDGRHSAWHETQDQSQLRMAGQIALGIKISGNGELHG